MWTIPHWIRFQWPLIHTRLNQLPPHIIPSSRSNLNSFDDTFHYDPSTVDTATCTTPSLLQQGMFQSIHSMTFGHYPSPPFWISPSLSASFSVSVPFTTGYFPINPFRDRWVLPIATVTDISISFGVAFSNFCLYINDLFVPPQHNKRKLSSNDTSPPSYCCQIIPAFSQQCSQTLSSSHWRNSLSSLCGVYVGQSDEALVVYHGTDIAHNSQLSTRSSGWLNKTGRLWLCKDTNDGSHRFQRAPASIGKVRRFDEKQKLLTLTMIEACNAGGTITPWFALGGDLKKCILYFAELGRVARDDQRFSWRMLLTSVLAPRLITKFKYELENFVCYASSWSWARQKSKIETVYVSESVSSPAYIAWPYA